MKENTKIGTALVSILLPVYNVSQYIVRCLESLIQQDYENIQVVIIDDGSNDSSFNVCREYANKYPNVIASTREHRGIAQTRKELIEQAEGEYILFVDSDDWVEPNTVSSMVRIAAETNSDITMCGMYYGNRPIYPMNSSSKSQLRICNGIEASLIFLKGGRLMSSLCNKLMRRNLFNGLHYREDLTAGEDLYMMWQIYPKVNIVTSTTELYYHYENNKGSLTRKSDVFNTEISFTIWQELEKESKNKLEYNRSNVSSIVFYEAASYAHALLKNNDASAHAIIESLIPEFRKRLPNLKIRTRLQILKALWGLSGIIGGYRFMKLFYRIYHSMF